MAVITSEVVRKIEQTTGHKVVYISTAGSRLYGLTHKLSDYDYRVIVWAGCENTPYNPTGAYIFPEICRGDFYFTPLTESLRIQAYAGIWPAQSYVSVIYAHPSIRDFLSFNGEDLSNMSPYHYYTTTLNAIDRELRKGNSHTLAHAVREAGLLYNFMATGSVAKSLYLNDEFSDMYWKLKNQEIPISVDVVKDFISFIYDDGTREFFIEFRPNYDLFEQLCVQLTKARDVG